MTPLRILRANAAALAAALAAFAVTTGAPIPSTSASATSTTQPATMSAVAARTETVGVSLVPDDQGIVRPGDDLALTIGITNTTTSTLPAGTATVSIDASATSRSELAAWLAPEDAAEPGGGGQGSNEAERAVLTVPTPSLVAGQSVVLAGTVVPAAALGLVEPAALGARALLVEVSTGSDVVGTARSAVSVAPVVGTTVTSVALATPLDVPASGSGLLASDELEAFTAPAGVLTRQLDQAIGRPIAIGIDPRVIVSIRALGDSAPQSATLWLQRLEGAPNETFPLAYADADVTALSQSGAGVLLPTSVDLDPGLFSAPPTASASPDPEPSASQDPGGQDPGDQPAVPTLDDLLAWDYSMGGVVWPLDDTVVASDLETFAAAGLTTTIVSSSNVDPATGDRPRPAATAGDRRLAVSDDAISAAFRTAVQAPTITAWQAAMAELGASLATAAAEGASADGAPSVLATLDRAVPTGSYRLADTLAGLQAMPWVATSGFAAALQSGSTETRVVDSPVADDRMEQFSSLLATEAATSQFATVLDSPELIVGERRLSLLAVSSSVWATQAEAWVPAVEAYRARSSEILTSVQIVQSSDLLLPSQNGDLPISVANTLPFPVTVTVTVRPQTPILNVLDSAVEVTVEAESQTRAPVPVQSVANGDVTIAVSLTSPTGAPISQPVFTTISVQAQWESAAVAVIASLIIGVFAFGVFRTVRRRLAARKTDG